MADETYCTAFQGTVRIASGPLAQVAAKVKAVIDAGEPSTILIFDDVEVVDQPLRARRDRVTVVDDPGDRVIRAQQHAVVVGEAAAQRVSRARSLADSLCSREALGVLLESLDAEQLGADRIFRIGERLG
jgi:hypothetical protein